MIRDHENRIDKSEFENSINILKNMIDEILEGDFKFILSDSTDFAYHKNNQEFRINQISSGR